jgi:hypothetical protein
MKSKATRPKVYLAGRMGNDPRDKQWRLDITPFCNKLKFKVLNPYLLEPLQLRGLRPGRLPEKAPNGKKITHWSDLKYFPQDSPEYLRFKRYMRAIIDYDMNLVENVADLLIVRWSDGCKEGCGTQGEVSLARILRKPVYTVKESKDDIPDWLQGCSTRIFSNFEELQKFLTEEYGAEKDAKEISDELIN